MKEKLFYTLYNNTFLPIVNLGYGRFYRENIILFYSDFFVKMIGYDDFPLLHLSTTEENFYPLTFNPTI